MRPPKAPKYARADAPRFENGRLLCPTTPRAVAQLEIASRQSPARLPGLVLDWVLLSSSGSITLDAATTYLVSGTVNVTTLTIEGGTVVKYTNSAAAKIYVSGNLTTKTSPYRPAVFTSKDDNTVGEVIPGSSGTPSGYYGNPMLEYA